MKNFVIHFFWIWPIMKVDIIHCCIFLYISHICEKFGSWDIGQNAIDQLDCKIFQSAIWAIFLGWNDELVWYFVCRYKFMDIEISLNNIWVCMVKKWVWSLCSQESKIGCISRRNWWNQLIFCMMLQMQES